MKLLAVLIPVMCIAQVITSGRVTSSGAIIRAGGGGAHPEAATVLIVVNDAVSDSTEVGEYYATRRGIPFGNIVHITARAVSCSFGTDQWDCWHISATDFDTDIRQPIKDFMTAHSLTSTIRYIVPVWGVPSHSSTNGSSIDSWLSCLNGCTTNAINNPYYKSDWSSFNAHFKDWVNPLGWQMYIVSRLDGPSAAISKALVDKAIAAESILSPSDGIDYYDYRDSTVGDGALYPIDQAIIALNTYASGLGHSTVLNNNHNDPSQMIHSAPTALWAWGWYSSNTDWTGYDFVPGAVGAQFTSYTATGIRYDVGGAWVPVWLSAGITATWGATYEPTTAGYATGERLFRKFWAGYNFGESAYQASPFLGTFMVFIGDPLYAPRVFQP